MTFEGTIHKNILIHILRDIYTDSKLGPFLGFKGGTAVYLFYELPRFSVDLDFDLLDDQQRQFVFESVKNIVTKYGKIKEAEEKRWTIFFLLSYDNKAENAPNIKVEINLRDFGSRYEIKSYFGIAVKVMIQEDIVAHKMVAMTERIGKANRDIFDVWFFLKNNWPINELIVQQRTGLAMPQFLEKCIELLESMSDRGILSDIGELLTPEQKVWAKTKLRTDTIFYLRLKLESYK